MWLDKPATRKEGVVTSEEPQRPPRQSAERRYRPVRNRPEVAFIVVGRGAPCGRVWLGVWDGIRNYLITAA